MILWRKGQRLSRRPSRSRRMYDCGKAGQQVREDLRAASNLHQEWNSNILSTLLQQYSRSRGIPALGHETRNVSSTICGRHLAIARPPGVRSILHWLPALFRSPAFAMGFYSRKRHNDFAGSITFDFCSLHLKFIQEGWSRIQCSLASANLRNPNYLWPGRNW